MELLPEPAIGVAEPVAPVAPRPSVRPVASGEWVFLGLLGLTMAAALNGPFLYSSLALLVMGCIYNIPPVRSKDLPYADVLSESINNPLRLMLGWFAVAPGDFPPASLL